MKNHRPLADGPTLISNTAERLSSPKGLVCSYVERAGGLKNGKGGGGYPFFSPPPRNHSLNLFRVPTLFRDMKIRPL